MLTRGLEGRYSPQQRLFSTVPIYSTANRMCTELFEWSIDFGQRRLEKTDG